MPGEATSPLPCWPLLCALAEAVSLLLVGFVCPCSSALDVVAVLVMRGIVDGFAFRRTCLRLVIDGLMIGD